MKSFKFRRIVSFLVLFTFLWTQVASPQELELVNQSTLQPTKAPSISPNAQVPKPLNQIPQTTEQFLQDTLTLTPVSEEKEEKVIQPIVDSKNQDLKTQSNQSLEYERYDFKDALDLLRPDYASAVIVKNLTSEDLHALRALSFETGIIVLHGEIVLFTSGSPDEIGVLPAVKELIQKASFISHTHTGEFSKEGPSGADLERAVSSPNEEYVITHQGVYVYNHEGVINSDPYSYDWYIGRLNQALEASNGEGDQVAARSDLNQFIKEQDRYNQAPESEKEILRLGGTWTYTPGLTISYVTTLPGSPSASTVPGLTGATTISYDPPSGILSFGYSVPNVNDSSGVTISFDNPSTPAIETQDLTTFSAIFFGLMGPNASVRFDVFDINGVPDSFTLTDISNTTEFIWQVRVSSIASVDKTRIKNFNFYINQSNTTSTTRTGTLNIRTYGLATSSAPSQPVVTSVVPPSTNQTTLAISGTKDANTSIFVNGVEAVALNSSTTWSTTLNLATEGNNTFNITAKNSAGALSTARTITILRDTVVPTGSININSGAVYASSTSVTLNLSAIDSSSGIDKMSFSTNNSIWTAPEAYATSKTYTLPTGDGTKTVYAKYYDKAGNISVVYSRSIILDTLPPTGTVTVNNGAQYIKQTGVTLNLSATDLGSGLNQMSFSSDNVTYSVPEIYAATKAWTFSTGDGNKTVYVKFSDQSGKWSTAVSVTVLLDTVLPTGTININSGAAYTNSTSVTLTLSGADTGSGIDKMNFSTDNIIWTTTEAFSATKTFTLPTGDGTKTIYARFYDKAGNPSVVYSKSIILDTTPPAINLLSTATSSIPNYALSYTVDGVRKDESVTLVEGKNFIVRAATDLAGNSATKTFQITLESGPPVLQSFQINQASSMTKSANVTLSLIAYDLGSQVAQMSFSNDGVNYSTPETFAMTKTWTLTDGRGQKTVWVKVKDSSGFWSVPVSATIFYQKVLMLDDFDGTSQVQTYWDSNGNQPYQRTVVTGGAFEGINAMRIDFQKTSAFSYAYFALQPNQDGIANDFSTYRTLRVQLNKLHLTPMVLMAKLEFNGTSQTFETQVGIPQGNYGWQEAIFDFSTVSPTLLKSVKNILFFVDPSNPTSQGSFMIDNIRLDIWPETKVVDDFEGNNIPIQTYWDSNGALIYQRNVTETNAYDGTHSMKVTFTKRAGYPYSFFAWTPKQDGVNNNFTNYGTLRFNLNKISGSPMVIMMKLEFNGTTQTFEQQLSFPQGSNQWQEVVFDFSQVSAILLASVKNVFFFVDPASETTTGSFYMDRIRLAERPIERVVDDFEGNNSLVQTYWDGDGSGTVYTRTIDNTQGFDGTHSMQVNYNKSAQYPTAFFAITPKQDGIANDFSRYNVLKIMVKKETLPLMRLMMKFDLDGTQINFESWKEIPQGQTGWTELDYDFSSLDPSILKKVRNILFFVDPMFYTTPQASQGTFHIDSIKLGFQSDLPAKQFDPTKPPQVGWVASSVAGDIDNEYHVGSLVRINAWELNAAGDLLDGTVRVVSKSTGYDSGEQRLIFTHDGQFWPFHWDTTGLKAADDYGVIVTMRDKSGNVTVVGSETSPALTIKLTRGVPPAGELLRIEDFSLPRMGDFFTVARSYDPTDAEVFDHQLGLGWHSSLDYFVQDFPDGTASVSLGAGGYQFYFKNPDGTYRSMAPNNYSILTKVSGGFQIKLKDGTIYQLTSSPFIDLNTNSTTWFITKIIDPNGNQTQFFYDENRNLIKVQAPSGDSVQLQYSFRTKDQFNTNKYNLDKIIDQAGNIWTFQHDSKGNLISVTDPLNQKTTYEYDSNSRLTKITYPDTSTQGYTYNSEGRILQVSRNGVVQSQSTYGDRNSPTFSVQDALGRTSTYTLSDEGLLLQSTDPSGATTQFTYDSKRNLIKKVDPQGNVYTFTYDSVGNLLTSTDPLGNVATFTYEPTYNKVKTTKDALGNIATLTYDAKGNLTGITDSASNVTQNTYDLSGNLIQTKDPLGNTTSYTYDLRGLPLTQINAFGNIVSYQYDSRGNVLKITDPLAGVTQFTYDVLNRPVSQTDALGRKITNSYDSMGRVIQRTDTLGNTTTYQYNLNGQLASETNALGSKTSYSYDVKGNLVTQTDALGNVTTFTYDNLDRVIQIKDPLGRTISFAYDSLGRKISQTDPLGNIVRFQYDALGRLTKTTFPNGGVQTTTYDALGRVLSKTDPLGNITRFTYDSRGNLISQTDALGSVTTFTYDANNRRTSVKDAVGNTTTVTYDALGRLIKTTYADGANELRSYDALNRLIKVTDPLSRSATYAYDAVGNLIQTTDPAGNFSQVQYDALNRKVKEIDPLGNATTYTYDALGRLTKITDAKGNITTMTYDLLGRLLSRIYPDNTSETFTYDAAGNVTQSKDRIARTTQFTYDAGNRLLQKIYPDSSKDTFTYDVMGNVLTLTNSAGTIQNQYDLLGRLTKQTDVFGNVSTYTYDAIGNRKSLTATIGTSTLSRAYTYDALGRLTQIQDEKGRKTTYTYDSRSRVTQKVLPNATKTAFTYDLASELTQIVHQDPLASAFRTLQYTYDNRGLIINKTDSFEGTSSFSYDKLGELISITHPVIGLVTFALDQLGNRTQVSTAGTPQNYTTNALNEYTQAGTGTLQYDADGNLISRLDTSTNLITTYNYDFNNRLTKVTNPDGTIIAFTYDALGRRITKTVGSITTRFLWDGAGLLAELDPQNKLLKSYVNGPIVDEVLYQDDAVSGVTLYYHQDNLESTVALTDSQGVLKESYTYDPYGKIITAKDKLGNQILTPSTRILYTGREFDRETNLYYNRARYYDPSLGRFLSADPKGYAAGLDLYTYVYNNPLSFRDPSGLDVYWGGGYGFFGQPNNSGQTGGGGKKHKRGGFLGIIGAVLGIIAVVVAAPLIGAVAGAIGSAIGGVVGGVASAVAGSAVGAAVGGAVSAVVGTAVAGAATAVVSGAVNNLVQGAPVFRGVATNAITGAITSPLNGGFSSSGTVGEALAGVARTVGSFISNTVNAISSIVTNVARAVSSFTSALKYQFQEFLGIKASLPSVGSVKFGATISGPLTVEGALSSTISGPMGLYGFNPNGVSVSPTVGLSVPLANINFNGKVLSGGNQIPIGPVTIVPFNVAQNSKISSSASIDLGFSVDGIDLSFGSVGVSASRDS